MSGDIDRDSEPEPDPDAVPTPSVNCGALPPDASDMERIAAGCAHGLDDDTLADMRENGLDAVLNVAGVVSFTPPIDEGFRVNTQGVLNLMDLCRELGDETPLPLLHTSTCYVAGYRCGHVFEDDPRDHPFPRHDELSAEDWDPERELREGGALGFVQKPYEAATLRDAIVQAMTSQTS